VSIYKHETVKLFGAEKAQQYIPDYGFGCRRSSPSGGFPEALKSENVNVILASVVGFTESGVIDSNGGVTDVDVVICATSYAAFMPNYPIIGRDGRNLGKQITTTGKSYLSVMNEGFPNLFCKSVISPVDQWWCELIPARRSFGKRTSESRLLASNVGGLHAVCLHDANPCAADINQVLLTQETGD
jgi:hypothetical protein